MDKKMVIHYISLDILCLFLINTSKSYQIDSIYAKEIKEVKNKIVHGLMLNEFKHVKSKITCVGLCLSDIQCSSVFFEASDASCQLHSVVYPDTSFWVQENGWRYFQIYEDPCPPSLGYIHNRALGICYKYFTIQSNWDEANRRCEKDGAELIKIDTKETQKHIEEYLAFSGFSDERVFIQGYGATSGGLWVYDDGKQMAYTNWLLPAMGHNVDENRIHMVRHERYLWDDIDGTHPAAFICQIAICESYKKSVLSQKKVMP